MTAPIHEWQRAMYNVAERLGLIAAFPEPIEDLRVTFGFDSARRINLKGDPAKNEVYILPSENVNVSAVRLLELVDQAIRAHSNWFQHKENP